MPYKTVEQKRFEAARQEWCNQMRDEGKKVVGDDQYDSFSDVVSLLCLAVRQIGPFDHRCNDLRARMLVLFNEAQAELSTMVRYRSFTRETITASPPERLPDLVLTVEETTETEETNVSQ